MPKRKFTQILVTKWKPLEEFFKSKKVNRLIQKKKKKKSSKVKTTLGASQPPRY
jgi:hypothetical protein